MFKIATYINRSLEICINKKLVYLNSYFQQSRPNIDNIGEKTFLFVIPKKWKKISKPGSKMK